MENKNQLTRAKVTSTLLVRQPFYMVIKRSLNVAVNVDFNLPFALISFGL